MEDRDKTYRQLLLELEELRQRAAPLEASEAERKRAEETLRLNEARLQALVQLNQMAHGSLQEVADFTLEAAVALTGSRLGYLAFMNEDETVLTMHAWSKKAMQQCAIQDKPIIYPIATTGLWGEPVRQRKPVITNDYEAPNLLKKGYPEGHVHVLRHMNVPIFDSERIVIVAGVGNKDAPYDKSDVRQLTLLMQGMWLLIQRRRGEEKLRKSHDELETRVRQRTAELAEANQLLRTELAEHIQAEESLRDSEQVYRRLLAAVNADVYSVRLEDGVPAATEYGLGRQSVTGSSPADYAADPWLWINMVHPDDRKMVQQHVVKVLAGEDVPPIEHRIIHQDRATHWVRNTIFSHRDRIGRLVYYDGVMEDITQYKRDEERRKRDAEFLAAQTIQQHLLPDSPPTLPGFDIAGMTYPAEFAAGDYFDYLHMPDGLVGFVVADVTSHGIGSALIAASTQAYLRSLAETHTEVDGILKIANTILYKTTGDDHFVTLLLARLDPWTRSFAYASAGHQPGYILSSSGDVKARLESTGFPLGISPDAAFPVCDPMTLEPGDVVVLLTDGLPEARSPKDFSFGTERAIDVVRSNRDRTAHEIVASVYGAWRRFSERNAPLDDITVVVIKVQPAP